MASEAEDVTFSVTVTMRRRWVRHFLAMLRQMQRYGSMGMSRQVAIYSDGDGDFRPRFEWDSSLPSDADPVSDSNGDVVYDAG